MSFECGSNVNDESEEQIHKHLLQRTKTEDGMQIDFNAIHDLNARLSIRVSFEPDSNVKTEREEQPSKHSLPRIPTDDGIQTDFNALQPSNALLSI
jgi:hypothetical protein